MEIQLLVLVLALLGAWYYSSLPASTPIRENRNRKNYIIFVCIIFQRFFPVSALTVRKCETKIRVPVVSDRIPLILFLANT